MRKLGVSALIALGLVVAAPLARAQETGDDEETALKGEPNGLTADAVGKRAAQTSYQAQASAESLRGAAARVDAAWAAFLPRLATTASYTRLSPLTPPSLGNIVVSTGPSGPVDCAGGACQAVPFSFPVILDNWLLQASLSVPISDYFLRIDQNYTAATNARDAARFDLGAARTKSASDGKLAFYNYLRAKGSLVVAKLALDDQKTHLTDTKNLAEVGNATRVDVLRGETAVAAAELAVVQTQNFLDLAAKQLRIALHVEDSASIASAETLDGTALPPVQGALAALISEAQSQRFEVKSIDANAAAARQQAKSARAGAYPNLSAFGDAVLANPNQRLFPQTQDWFPTWDLGVRLTWSPNDIPTALASSADASSRAAALDAQKLVLRDGIAVEVTQAYQAVQEADFSLGSTAKQLSSAREAVRVARELFKAGRVNSTTLTDAETDLTRARLALLNARIDARTARVRLDHALGRDNSIASIGP
ncbi:MAG TPA: TolC family protein [Polyangiaceae bacterium]